MIKTNGDCSFEFMFLEHFWPRTNPKWQPFKNISSKWWYESCQLVRTFIERNLPKTPICHIHLTEIFSSLNLGQRFFKRWQLQMFSLDTLFFITQQIDLEGFTDLLLTFVKRERQEIEGCEQQYTNSQKVLHNGNIWEILSLEERV